ncbi:heparinase II/III domain-containing protein [Aeromonas sp. PS2Canimalfood6]|uniref:heparinase II/III domain-containing protein n=1 Tax=Aeromonas sp. PS2Canimalfood6 TaxID=3397770 RepID=UPI003AA9534A
MFSQSGYFSAKNSTAGIFFSTAKRSTVHSHSDQLSFEWFDFDEPIIVDAGKYGYTSGPERRYVLSADAHNCLLINQKPVTTELFKSNVIKFEKLNSGILISAFLQGDASSQTRSIYFSPGNFLLVIDDFTTEKISEIKQKFQFNYTSEINDDSDSLTLKNKTIISYDVDFYSKDTKNDISTKIISGTENDRLASFVSDKYKSLKTAPSIINVIEASSGVIATIFSKKENLYKVKLEDSKTISISSIFKSEKIRFC